MDVFFEFLIEVLGLVPQYAPAATLIVLLVQAVKWLAEKYQIDFLLGRSGLVSLVLNAAFWVAGYFLVQGGYEAQYLAVLEDATKIADVLLPILISAATTWLAYQAAKKTGATGKVD